MSIWLRIYTALAVLAGVALTVYLFWFMFQPGFYPGHLHVETQTVQVVVRDW